VIIDEIMGQVDHDTWHKSFNIYYTHTSKNREENNKINFGPIWDYDWCLNTPWTGKPNEYYEFNDKIEYCGPFYNVAFEIEEFYDTLKLRYNKYAKPALKKYIDGYDNLVEGIEESMQANAEIWYRKYDSELTSKNVKFLKDYLAFRYELLNEAWAK
ncbi:MAG: CotH kinase family protein, partial [Clostridia bacterium]|nr:CotH kinase family protein [Clostridia bacterium]